MQRGPIRKVKQIAFCKTIFFVALIDIRICILGQVHLALATYHEICRFTDNGTYDHEVALFHLKAAAECGIISAIISVARMYFGLSHDILSEVTIEHEDNDIDKLSKGLDYMKMAAQAMERSALVFMAQSYEFGINGADLDLDQSLYWYEQNHGL